MKKEVAQRMVRALYIRVSTEAQAEEGFSVQAQTQRLIAYCTAMGWDDYALYTDGGFSGSNLNRPDMQRLIADVEAGKVKSVVVYKLDRLSRSQKDTLFLIEDVFMPRNVDFVSLNESIDTSTPYGRAMIGILSAFAQLERENIFMRTRMGMLERVKQGYWMGGGSVPFGYDYDREQGILVPNQDARIVRKMYDLYIKGYSAQRIANMFDIQYDRVVMQILARKSNLGLIPYKGEAYQGRHEAIVSQEVFDLAQRKMRERGAARVTERSAHLLTGLVYCGGCGARMRYIKWGKAGFKLRCYSLEPSKPYMHKDDHCTAEAVWADQIEDVVLKDLFRISADMEKAIDPGRYTFANPLEEMQQQVKRLEAKLKRLYNLYADSENDTLMAAIKENEDTLAVLKEDCEAEEKNQYSTKQLALIQDQVSSISAIWEHLTDMEKQSLIRDCVNRIVVTGARVEIYYSFVKADKQKQVA